MGLFSFLFGTPAPATALGEPVAPESLPADGNFPNTLSIEEAVFIAPSAMACGAKTAKTVKNRCAVFGTVANGSFRKGDTVIAYVGGKPVKALAHDVIEAERGWSDNLLTNRQWSKGEDITAGKTAYIILELTVEPDKGSKIVKL